MTGIKDRWVDSVEPLEAESGVMNLMKVIIFVWRHESDRTQYFVRIEGTEALAETKGW